MLHAMLPLSPAVLQESSPAKDDREAKEEPAGVKPTEGLRSKSPAVANHDKAAGKSAHSAEDETDTDDSDVDIETIEGKLRICQYWAAEEQCRLLTVIVRQLARPCWPMQLAVIFIHTAHSADI